MTAFVLVDLTNRRFGKLVVVDLFARRVGRIYWRCRCDCGDEHAARADHLTAGRTTSCGCERRIDLTGQRFGRLVVQDAAGKTTAGAVAWNCRCDCGQTHVVDGGNLRSGRTKSCGCIRSERAIRLAAERRAARANQMKEAA